VIEVILARAAAGATIVVSSHVLHEIEALTQNILLIHHGGVVAEGDVHAVRALIDQHPHQVRVECDRPREFARALLALPHVHRMTVEDGALIAETRAPDQLYPALPAVAVESGVTITALTSPDDNLSAVFRYLTRARAS
jgi:ABC-2 type transport system ATP-binding protein